VLALFGLLLGTLLSAEFRGLWLALKLGAMKRKMLGRWSWDAWRKKKRNERERSMSAGGRMRMRVCVGVGMPLLRIQKKFVNEGKKGSKRRTYVAHSRQHASSSPFPFPSLETPATKEKEHNENQPDNCHPHYYPTTPSPRHLPPSYTSPRATSSVLTGYARSLLGG